MATMTLKQLPEELVKLLKREAKHNRRSLNQGALARLESSLALPPRRSGPNTVKALRRLASQLTRDRVRRALRRGRRPCR